MTIRTGEIPIWRGESDPTVEELRAALEVLERKLNSTTIHEGGKGYWVEYAIQRARRNLKRSKK